MSNDPVIRFSGFSSSRLFVVVCVGFIETGT